MQDPNLKSEGSRNELLDKLHQETEEEKGSRQNKVEQ